MDIIRDCEKLMKDYPLYSQEKNNDPTIVVKLFNAFGAGTWFLTEYDPKSKIAFGYVSIFGDWNDEWGSISIKELADLKIGGTIPKIERDINFTPKPFGEVKKEFYGE